MELVRLLIAVLGLAVVQSPADHSALGIYGAACDPVFRQYPGNVQALVCEGREHSIVVFANGEPHARWITANELGHYLYPDGLNEGRAWEFACLAAYDPGYCAARPGWAED